MYNQFGDRVPRLSGNISSNPMIAGVNINGVGIQMRIDSGCDWSIIGETEFREIRKYADTALYKTKLLLRPYSTTASQEAEYLPLVGEARVMLKA